MHFKLEEPSLQQRAMFKIICHLWSQVELNTQLLSDHFPLFFDEIDGRIWWQRKEDEVIEKVSTLKLPEKFKKPLRSIVRPIGFEIVRWWHYFCYENRFLDLSFPDQLFWTPHGMLDHKKTAEMMVKNENLELMKRYKLACIYCLEDDIRALYTCIPNTTRVEIYNNIRVFPPYPVSFNHIIIDYWFLKLLNEIDGFSQDLLTLKYYPKDYVLLMAINFGTLPAIEYLFEKLSREEFDFEEFYLSQNESGIFFYYNRVPFINFSVFCFLLNRMNEEQQRNFFSTNLLIVLECLLYWPWQSFFMETARRWWCYMRDFNWEFFVIFIKKFSIGYKDYDYKDLFREFWKLGSTHLKQQYLSSQRIILNLVDLFNAKEEELIVMILNEMTANQIEKLIFFNDEVFKSKTLIYKEEWDLIMFLMDKNLISEQMIRNCKRDILLPCPNELDDCREVQCMFLEIAEELVKNKNETRKSSGIEDGEGENC